MNAQSQNGSPEKRVLSGVAALVVGGLALGAFDCAPCGEIPTADVKRKEFIDYLEVKGEAKALRSG